MHNQAEEMALYVPPEKPWMLKLRSSDLFKAQLEDVVRLWQAHAMARGDDPERIDVSYVVRALLEKGVSDAFAEYGGRPTSDADWTKAERLIAQAIKSSTKTNR